MRTSENLASTLPKCREPEDVLALCQSSIKAHCKVFHPERFTRPFSRNHEELFELIDDSSVKNLLVMAHRGFGKTSLFNFALPSQHIVFQKSKFIIPCSAGAMHAITQSENLKHELMSNEAIHEVIGDIKSDTFTKDAWMTSNGVLVLPRGSGQQVRGALFRHSRPDLIIVDDLEDSESVLSEDQRNKVREWFFSDLVNLVDRSIPSWRVMVVGTLLHENALLQDLRDDPTWEHLDLPLAYSEDGVYKSYWPTYMTDDQVQDELTAYKRRGLLDVWFRENMNIANPREDAVFRSEHFQYYTEELENLSDDPEIDNIILVDPTKSEKAHSAYSAIVGVGIDYRRNLLFVRDVVNERITTDKLYEEVFAMAARINAHTIGIEVTGLNEFITQPFKNEMLRRGLHYEFVELKARQGKGEYSGRTKGKAGRVASLAPYYRMGAVRHNKSATWELEEQLLGFPRPKNWDIMDALAYVVEMLHIGDRYFETPDLDEGRDGYTDRESMEREYAELLKADDYSVEDPDMAELEECLL